MNVLLLEEETVLAKSSREASPPPSSHRHVFIAYSAFFLEEKQFEMSIMVFLPKNPHLALQLPRNNNC